MVVVVVVVDVMGVVVVVIEVAVLKLRTILCVIFGRRGRTRGVAGEGGGLYGIFNGVGVKGPIWARTELSAVVGQVTRTLLRGVAKEAIVAVVPEPSLADSAMGLKDPTVVVTVVVVAVVVVVEVETVVITRFAVVVSLACEHLT